MFSLLFNYDRAAGNKSANQRGVTRQLSVGWHQGLPGPSSGLPLYLSAQVWLHAVVQGMGTERWKNSKPLCYFNQVTLSLIFFSTVSPSSLASNSGCLSSLPRPFTASPHHITPFYLSEQFLPQCWRAGDASLPYLLLSFDPRPLCFLLLNSHPVEELRSP